MASKYEHRSKDALIEILKLRSLPQNGKRADLIRRLVESDDSPQAHQLTQVDKQSKPSEGVEFLMQHPDLYLFKYEGARHMRETNKRIARILARCNVPCAPWNVVGEARQLWERESKGGKLPALVYRGYVVADLTVIREWIQSGDLKERVDAACKNAFDKKLVDQERNGLPTVWWELSNAHHWFDGIVDGASPSGVCTRQVQSEPSEV